MRRITKSEEKALRQILENGADEATLENVSESVASEVVKGVEGEIRYRRHQMMMMYKRNQEEFFKRYPDNGEEISAQIEKHINDVVLSVINWHASVFIKHPEYKNDPDNAPELYQMIVEKVKDKFGYTENPVVEQEEPEVEEPETEEPDTEEPGE